MLIISASLMAQTRKVPDIILTEDNMVVLDRAFNRDTVSRVIEKVLDIDSKIPAEDPLYLVLDTGGGSVQAGLELIDTLKTLNRKIHTVPIFAASMGFHTVQGLGDRLIPTQGTLMSHKASGWFFGEFPGQLDSRYNRYLKRIMSMDSEVVKRTNGVHSLNSYHELIENEYWCDGQYCIDQGFADKIVNVQCDRSLNERKIEIINFLYNGMLPIKIEIQKLKCPLATGILAWKISVYGFTLYSEGDVEDNVVDDITFSPIKSNEIPFIIKASKDYVNNEVFSREVVKSGGL